MKSHNQKKEEERKVLGRSREGNAQFPVAAELSGMPKDYSKALATLKQRIQQERLRVVLSANAAMVLLYWDIGQFILDRQHGAGWGAKVIDRLAADLRKAFPDMKGFSPRNLKYMRAFASAWSDRQIVQGALAQITWYHNLALLEKVSDPSRRLWYAQQSVEHGWSRNILAFQIERGAHVRQGKEHSPTLKRRCHRPSLIWHSRFLKIPIYLIFWAQPTSAVNKRLNRRS